MKRSSRDLRGTVPAQCQLARHNLIFFSFSQNCTCGVLWEQPFRAELFCIHQEVKRPVCSASGSLLHTMKAPVILYVLLAFLDQGSSLQCEVCDGFEQDCSGPMQTCDPDQDTCGIIKGEEIYDGVKMLFNWKSCVTSNVCHYRNSGIYSRNSFRLRRSIACCTGEACRTVSVQLPPLNTTRNGLQCPACFSLGSYDCGNEIVYCTGAESYCFDVEGSLSKGEVSVKAAVKGCTSLSECKMSHDEKQELLRISVVFNRFECKPASPAASKASGWTLPNTLSLPIMVGLFLVKTMS